MRYVSHKHMKEVATDLKTIYSSATEEEAGLHLELFAEKWTMPIRDWKPALNRFAVEFAERFPQ